MNILLGKIGQKIIFDRNSSGCDRSNTNGNVGTYLLFKLLFDNNKKDTFYIASKNDLKESGITFDNVVDASEMSSEDLSTKIDAMMILAGLTEYETDDRFINITNTLSARYILLSDDPRCLDSVEKDKRFFRIPGIIISQFRDVYYFKGEMKRVIYEPIERASCYQAECYYDEDKTKDMIIISNESGKEYDRLQIIYDITKDLSNGKNIDLYGRMSEEKQKLLSHLNYKGEIKYSEMQKELRRSYSTLMVPIRKGWVTSKYVEALINGVLPVAYKDYMVSLLKVGLIIPLVSNSMNVASILKAIEKFKNTEMHRRTIERLREKLIYPYQDGKLLSSILMSYTK